MTWNKESICQLLQCNDRAVERALVRLYEAQTQDERQAGETRLRNGVGFTAWDAPLYSRLARDILAGRPLGPAAFWRLRRKRGITKYWKQLLTFVKEKEREQAA